ncbi:MAG: hypothetical protein RLZ42_253 [Armatimonadota bacterium]|jgi:hypothetical protein
MLSNDYRIGNSMRSPYKGTQPRANHGNVADVPESIEALITLNALEQLHHSAM